MFTNTHRLIASNHLRASWAVCHRSDCNHRTVTTGTVTITGLQPPGLLPDSRPIQRFRSADQIVFCHQTRWSSHYQPSPTFFDFYLVLILWIHLFGSSSFDYPSVAHRLPIDFTIDFTRFHPISSSLRTSLIPLFSNRLNHGPFPSNFTIGRYLIAVLVSRCWLMKSSRSKSRSKSRSGD